MHDFVQHQADQSLVTTAPLKRQSDILAKREVDQNAEVCQQRQGGFHKCLCIREDVGFFDFNENKNKAS